MPYCPKCGEEVEEGAKFCPSCGASLSGEVKPREKEEENVIGNINPKDFLHHPGYIMIIAGILLIIGSFGPWYSWGYTGVTAKYGGIANGIRMAVTFMGLILLYSSVVDLGYTNFLEEAVPPFSTSAILGILSLTGSLGALTGPFNSGWGIFPAIIGGFVSLFAAFRIYQKRLER